MMPLTNTQLRLVDGWQRGFPLDPTPYARIAFDLGVSELTVLGMLSELSRDGVLSRVGAIVEPNTAGASTLAALAVPPARLEEVAAVVNDESGVNHNYEREHHYNLWFVVTGRDRVALDGALGRIERQTGLDVLDLPLRAAYHIDLGFPLGGAREVRRRSTKCDRPHACVRVSDGDRALLSAIENGLPLTSRPFHEISGRTGETELAVIDRLRRLIAVGVIKRFGLIVRHRELGFTANGMVVWDIDDEHVDEIGEAFAEYPFVTLCYRRPRRRPDWPYNLFCMIHGRDRDTVFSQIDELRDRAGNPPMDVLFSRRRFKQHGARLSAA